MKIRPLLEPDVDVRTKQFCVLAYDVMSDEFQKQFDAVVTGEQILNNEKLSEHIDFLALALTGDDSVNTVEDVLKVVVAKKTLVFDETETFLCISTDPVKARAILKKSIKQFEKELDSY